MKLCKRIMAGVTLLLSLAMLLASLAGGAGIWIVKKPVTAKATRISERIESALDLADQSLDHVKESLARAAERLESVKEEQRELAQDPPRGNVLRRSMARTVQQRIAPELGDAHEKFHKLAEAIVVTNTVLEDVGNFPLLAGSGFDVDRLAEFNHGLSRVESSAWELSQLFGEPEADSDAAGAVVSRIEQLLQSLQGLIAEYASRVTEVRHRTEELKSRIFTWITPATILISFVCFWIALSQISLLVHAWSWLKHSDKNRLPA
jgi:hypothetical protein